MVTGAQSDFQKAAELNRDKDEDAGTATKVQANGKHYERTNFQQNR